MNLIDRDELLRKIDEEPLLRNDDNEYIREMRDQWHCDISEINAMPVVVKRRNIMTFLTEEQIADFIKNNDVITATISKGLDDMMEKYHSELKEENDILHEIVEYCFYNYPQLEDWLCDEYQNELQQVEEDDEFNHLDMVDKIIYLIMKHRRDTK